MNQKIMCALLFLSHALICMQEPFVNKKDDKIFTQHEIALNLVTLYYLDHQSICAFGNTSKHNNDLMIELAGTRKKIVGNTPELMEQNEWYLDAWHQYGSAYRSLYIRSDAKKSLHGKSYELLTKQKIKRTIHTYDIPTNDHITPLPYKTFPYYNTNKCYFYGVRKTTSYYHYRVGDLKVYQGISVYRFSFDGPSRLECRISDSNKKSWGLQAFLGYPLILKAILKSKTASDKKRKHINVHGKCNKIVYWDCPLEGVTIPDGYEEYIKNMDFVNKTAAWNLLDPCLVEAIQVRYQQQSIVSLDKPQ